jgi:hypothetical protein
MRTATILLVGLLATVGILDAGTGGADSLAPPWAPKFKVQEIDTGLKIGYAVLIADINGDRKPDIVVVDQHKVVWYENPTWKKRVILDGKTKPDNVCIAALDIDGDGKLDLVLGAGWKPSDTTNPGTLQWLKNPGMADQEWAMYPIPCDEPTVHRVRAIDIDGNGKPEIVMAPLQGRGATAKGNWMDGRPVRIMSYKVPAKDPEKPGSWKPVVLFEDDLHVVHNFTADTTKIAGQSVMELFTTSYWGVTQSRYDAANKRWTGGIILDGDQSNPAGSRGASEVKVGRWRNGPGGDRSRFVVNVEPWHGNRVTVHWEAGTWPPNWAGGRLLDDHLRWGHALWCADLDGDGSDEVIVGVRDDPNPKAGDTFTERRGVRIYKCTDGKGEKWERFILDNGGVAVEDLAAADLNGDGKIDIVAVGRATGNCRIYWNQGK